MEKSEFQILGSDFFLDISDFYNGVSIIGRSPPNGNPIVKSGMPKKIRTQNFENQISPWKNNIFRSDFFSDKV